MTGRPPGISLDVARREIAREAREALGIGLADNVLDLLARHLHLLYTWNARVNLTAIRDPREGIRRHVVESLAALPWLEACLPGGEGETRLLADLGSGNGYPALPLLAARPELRGELWERVARKAAFLAAVLRAGDMVPRVTIREASFSGRFGASPTVVTLRAFPDPARTIRSLLACAPTDDEKTSARRPSLLAWLSRDDADRLAEDLAALPGLRVNVAPLPTHPRGALLAAMVRR